MDTHRLTRAERNALFTKAKDLGLNPSDFDWSEGQAGYASYVELRHRPTGYACRFSGWEDRDTGAVGYEVWWSPLLHGRERGSTDRAGQLQIAGEWLAVVKEEHDTPDLWAVISAERELLATHAAEGDRPFSLEEKSVLNERLDLLQRQIADITHPSEPELTELQQAVTGLKEAAETMTRSHWKHFFVGVLFEQLFKLGVDAVHLQQILHIAGTYIAPLVTQVRGFLGM